MDQRPKYLDWVKDPDGEWVDNWDYREFKEYPRYTATEAKIKAFIKDAKEAEKAIEEDLMAEGKAEEEAKKLSCQWPLKDDTPMSVIREFCGYNHDLAEMGRKGIDA